MASELNALPKTAPIALRVGDFLEVPAVGPLAERYAADLGFSLNDCKEIALVATELATNLVKHASGGTMLFSPATEPDRGGIRIESRDQGPGIPDIEKALTDGFSTAGGLGAGLGTVNRLMDELHFVPLAPTGTAVVCTRWLRPSKKSPHARRLEIGVATRTYKQETENGDAFVVHQWDAGALVGVIDGLGHGQFAKKASQTARRYVDQHFDQPLLGLFRGAGRACSATRGTVMALARFDFERAVISIASVGNVEVRIVGGPRPHRVIARRGIVGFNAPQPNVEEHPWAPDRLLVMHSDGLTPYWHPGDFPEFTSATSDEIARRLLSALGNHEDDATVLVAKDPRI